MPDPKIASGPQIFGEIHDEPAQKEIQGPIHRTAARRRKDALHQYSRKIVDQYQSIYVGDVNSRKLVKTRMAKSVLDAGWGMLKTLLQCKGQQAAEAFESSARETHPAHLQQLWVPHGTHRSGHVCCKVMGVQRVW